MSRMANPDWLMDDDFNDSNVVIETPKNFEKMPTKKTKIKSTKKHDKKGNKKGKRDRFFEEEYND